MLLMALHDSACFKRLHYPRAMDIAVAWYLYLCSRVLARFGVNIVWMIELDRDTILLRIVRGYNGRSISIAPLNHDRIARFEAYILEKCVRAVEDGAVTQIGGFVLAQRD